MDENIPLLSCQPAAALKHAPFQLQAVNDCFSSLGITFRANREYRVSTLLSRSKPSAVIPRMVLRYLQNLTLPQRSRKGQSLPN